MTSGPLSGVTIVDLTRVLAGPYCTMVLLDLGARVIKVEVPETGDDARHYGPFIKGKSAYFGSLNRGKESIAHDLKAPEDRQVFEALLAQADVLVENYRPGTLEKLGYGWETLHPRYPRLIYAAASGFGHSGPYSKRAAYDMVVQGMGGIMSVTGHPGGPPTRVGTSVGDITAGLFTAVGVNGALYHRERTGEGIKIDVAMLDCQIAILENAIARYVATGQIPGPLGARHASITPFEAFHAKDGHLIVAAGNDVLFAKLADALGRPDLKTNDLFRTNDLRTSHHDALKVEIEAALASDTVEVWLDRLGAAGIPSGPINNVAQALADPQIAARNMVVSVDDPVSGTLKMAGNPIKMSAFPDPKVRGPVPDLDGDRAAIVAEFLAGSATGRAKP
ncbi:MAG: CaiB/BaiF CoA transferase family protein [Candidatus Eiseniibacteriota bacterium]